MSNTIPSVEDVEGYDTERLIAYLQTKISNLGEKDFIKLRDQYVDGQAFVNMTQNEFAEPPFNFGYGKAKNLGVLINRLNSQRLLSQEQALLCVPLPIGYHPNVITSQGTTYSGDQFPTEIRIWDLFEEVNNFHFNNEPKFERPQFGNFPSCINEEDIRGAFYYNICQVLNVLLPDYEFSRQPVPIAGIPDFSALFGAFKFIAPIEIKREHVLLSDGKQTFLYFDETTQRYEMNEHARDVIRQIFTYMAEAELQYGVLSTYQHHWFLRRPADEPSVLYISDTLLIHSQSPPVLKTYAYMVQVLCADSFSRNPVITTDKRKRQSVSYSESTTKSTKRGRTTVIASKKKSSSSTNEIKQTPIQNINFADFKYKSILGQGRSGKTLLCEFRGNTIALKCADLSKTPHVLKEMQQEVNIYRILSDIQGIHIPNLLCYGFYGGMYYAIGMTLVGSALNNYKHITERQRAMGLLALNAIHDRGVLHNDIREENILLDDTNDAVYLIDFGMARYHCDAKKSWRLFDEERRKLIRLLDHYTLLDSVIVE
uniref:Serine/threonine-protein kinase grp n=1 Tax=Anthurium amnicola TaxID=1678845 RepID=A0A1D1Y2D2_9ARAE